VTTQPDTDAPPTRRECNCGATDRGSIAHAVRCSVFPAAPQEGRPTTPQTEALICVCGKPLALSHISWDANYSPHTPEAATGALPSVERLAEALLSAEDDGWFGVGYEPKSAAEAILERIAAAPPEASER
jgi:hypothetical protein